MPNPFEANEEKVLPEDCGIGRFVAVYTKAMLSRGEKKLPSSVDTNLQDVSFSACA